MGNQNQEQRKDDRDRQGGMPQQDEDGDRQDTRRGQQDPNRRDQNPGRRASDPDAVDPERPDRGADWEEDVERGGGDRDTLRDLPR